MAVTQLVRVSPCEGECCGFDSRQPPFDKLRVLLYNRSMPWVVYILLCDQKTYYIGISSSLGKRLCSHKSKYNIGTKEFSDIKLVYKEEYISRNLANKREKQLKGWTVAKKKALIEGNMNLLKQLSKTRSLVEVGNQR